MLALALQGCAQDPVDRCIDIKMRTFDDAYGIKSTLWMDGWKRKARNEYHNQVSMDCLTEFGKR
jgi:hypothetical protein